MPPRASAVGCDGMVRVFPDSPIFGLSYWSVTDVTRIPTETAPRGLAHHQAGVIMSTSRRSPGPWCLASKDVL